MATNERLLRRAKKLAGADNEDIRAAEAVVDDLFAKAEAETGLHMALILGGMDESGWWKRNEVEVLSACRKCCTLRGF